MGRGHYPPLVLVQNWYRNCMLFCGTKGPKQLLRLHLAYVLILGTILVVENHTVSGLFSRSRYWVFKLHLEVLKQYSWLCAQECPLEVLRKPYVVLWDSNWGWNRHGTYPVHSPALVNAFQNNCGSHTSVVCREPKQGHMMTNTWPCITALRILGVEKGMGRKERHQREHGDSGRRSQVLWGWWGAQFCKLEP